MPLTRWRFWSCAKSCWCFAVRSRGPVAGQLTGHCSPGWAGCFRVSGGAASSSGRRRSDAGTGPWRVGGPTRTGQADRASLRASAPWCCDWPEKTRAGDIAGSRGSSLRLRINLAPSTVWEILQRAGIEPAPRRSGESWRGFLRAQAAGIVACDFLTVETVLLRRLYVLVFVELASRRVHLAGITANPTWEWVTQQARNVVADLAHVTFLIRDRDAKFSKPFDDVFRSESIRIIPAPVKAPRANAVCECWIGSLRRECLDRLLIFGRGHLIHVLAEYADHFNRHRPHRSLGQRAPQDWDRPETTVAKSTHIRRRDRLGGLIHEYEIVA